MEYRFADCTLDPATRHLRRAGQEVHVEPQVFDLLVMLAEAAPALVSYDAMIAEIWQGRIVSDATLAARISAARAATGDDGKRQAVIRTHPKRGVQMAVPVAGQVAGGAARPEAPTDIRQTLRYATSRDGTAIAWAETGQGPPLLRGGHWLSHLEHDWQSPVWRPFLTYLSATHRLVRYDPRGTGLSDRELTGGVEAFTDDMEAVADAAGLDRFPIYATSQSVPVALSFAARNPGRVTRMFLLNGFAQGDIARGQGAQTEALVAMIRAGWGVAGSALMQAVATVFMPDATAQEIDSMVEMQAVSASPDTAADLRRRIAEIDVSALLGQITCPVLVAHNDGDAVQPVEQSRLMARALGDARLEIRASRNHVFVPSDPVAWDIMDALERFLAEEDGP